MSFTLLSLATVLAGLIGLATLLYALQRLRIRHRPVTVVTTLFWRVAAEEAPARTFTERFRHPWAYALILLIAALLWLAFAGPEPARSSGGAFHVLVLDGSAGMAGGSRFDAAVAALKKKLTSLPVDQRQVIWSGAGERTLLNPGEHPLLMEKRLAGLRPEAAPAGVESLLRQLAVAGRPGRTTSVVIFGDAPVRPETLALLPDVKVSRATLGARPAARNAGLTALGVTAAASGAWDRVDVFFRVESDAPSPATAPALQIDLDGRTVPADQIRPVHGDSAQGYLLANLPAAGGLLTVRLTTADALALDDVAHVRLPDKPRLKVQLAPSLVRSLRPVLEADPAVQLVESGAQVVIRRAGEALGPTLPALEFVPAGAQQPAFRIVHPEKLDTAAVFAHAVQAIGLKEIDAMALADTARRHVEVTVATGAQWRFQVWQELLSDEFNFTQARAFPLFIAQAVRWLAGARTGYPMVAAGQPLAAGALEPGDRFLGPKGQPIDPLGVPYVPEQAGELRRENEARPLAVSLLDPATTLGSAAGAGDLAASESAGLGLHPATWLLLAALVLLGVEWYLYQTGRVP